ncbi:hypothetical protein, partial [Limnospira fusiformis]|nr:hypothetical protein [Limnospira fusiformis LS22]
NRVFTSGAVCWETRMHGFELELEGATSLSTIPNRLVPTITLVDGVLPTVPDEARNKHQDPAMSGFV